MRRFLIVFPALLLVSACLPQRLVDVGEEGSPLPRSRTWQGGTNPEIETATFALG